MASNASAPADVIALPSGGGALCGIGELFSPQLQTGTASLSVSIAVPPGRNGLQPDLALRYSSTAGNGAFGIGWSFGTRPITRRTALGVPVYDDGADTFMLAAADELVPVPGDVSPSQRYRLRTEGAFSRIAHRRTDADDYWEVRATDGSRTLFGTPGARLSDPATIADPADPARIFAWFPTATIDAFGNRIVYEYARDTTTNDGAHHWDQLYLATVRYIDFGPAGAPSYLVSVAMTYEPRPDPFSQYRSGFEIRTVRRCSMIEVFTFATGATGGVGGSGPTLVRSYHLTYQDALAAQPGGRPLPGNRLSLLAQVTVVGHDGTASESKPPLALAYTAFDPRQRTFAPITGAELPVVSLAEPGYELVDIFGCGLPDILEMNGTVRYWRNIGDGRYAVPHQMQNAPSGFGLDQPGVQLLDADGDGRADLLVTTPQTAGYFPLQFDGGWDQRDFRRYAAAPSFDLGDPSVRLLDLDGDGVTDALRTGARLECFFNDPVTGWTTAREVERRALSVFPDVDFTDPRVRIADMTGDGLQDIVLVHDRGVDYWPNLGHGSWAGRVHMRNGPHLPYGYAPERVLIGDVDGDGAADFVYVGDRDVTLWINQSGNGWADPIVIPGTPPTRGADTVRLADVLGTGVSGVLWTADAEDASRSSMFFLDFTGATKPYLLNEIDNSIGAHTEITYRPSTVDYLRDAAHLATRWQTPLPFPVQVIGRVVRRDAIAGSAVTSEYRYRHGYWDGADREFRGFGRVDVQDAEEFAGGDNRPLSYAPPAEARTWFHVGAVSTTDDDAAELDLSAEYWMADPPALPRRPDTTALLARFARSDRRDALTALRGSVLRRELYARDGTRAAPRPYTVDEFLVSLREESPPGLTEGPRRRVFFPHAVAERHTTWERGDEPLTALTLTDGYDPYGRPASRIAIAVPRGRDYRIAGPSGSPYLATRTVTTYAQRDDTTHYMVDREARVTSYDVANDGSAAALDLAAATAKASAGGPVIAQVLAFFDGVAFTGLPLGQLGDYGAATRVERLVLTDAILHAAYDSGSGGVSSIPPYLTPAATPTWTADYPTALRTLLPQHAGYLFRPGGADSEEGFFAVMTQHRYDVQGPVPGVGRGRLMAVRDALGRESTYDYDAIEFLVTGVHDAAGLTQRVDYDYRTLQPRLHTDQNGNRTAFTFTPLGMVASIADMGKVAEAVGDTATAPSTRYTYDFAAFVLRGEPISVRATRRLHHVTDTSVPPAQRDDTIDTVDFSDGFGRVVQRRAQAEDILWGDPTFGNGGLTADQTTAPRPVIGVERSPTDPVNVVVSGWATYDNKGAVVERYEPFYDRGWHYAPPTAAQRGQKASMFYDALGRLVRTVNPDQSEQRVVFGVPGTVAVPRLDDPDDYAPTPWERYTYDANDNAGRTDPVDGAAYATHWNTPTSVTMDARGREVTRIVRNAVATTGWYATSYQHDASDNVIAVTDALGRVVMQRVYDLAHHALRIASVDGGIRTVVPDPTGVAVESRDAKGGLRLRAADVLNRPLRVWARDVDGEAVTLRERYVYGDAADAGLPVGLAAASNLLGKAFRSYDEAGLLVTQVFDFKGNLLDKTRFVISDAAIETASPAAPAWAIWRSPVDWEPTGGASLDAWAAGLLDATPFRVTTSYDALNRLIEMQLPADVTGGRRAIRAAYDRGGMLTSVLVDGTVYVDRIAYNAKGQRTLAAFGNGVMTLYAYDPHTFRPTRQWTGRYARSGPLTYAPTGKPLQDYGYTYDLAGSVVALRDRTPGSGVPGTPLGTDALNRSFEYDPLYRLITATGRECDQPWQQPWDALPRCEDLTRTRGYTETYSYDAVGALVSLAHVARAGSFTRVFAADPAANRLATMTIGSSVYAYAYDACGNQITETTSRHSAWDHADRLRSYQTRAGSAEPSLAARYLYDPGGHRVKKLVRRQGGGVESVIYIDGVFECCRRAGLANNMVHVIDTDARLASIRIGPPLPGDGTPAEVYTFADHLRSNVLTLDSGGARVGTEEYTPFGETSFAGFARQRYRFTSKERDEESGYYYHGARYYVPWTGRWVSPDPLVLYQLKGDLNSYAYVAGRALTAVDASGLDGTLPAGELPPGGLPPSLAQGESVPMERTVPSDAKTADPALPSNDTPVTQPPQTAGQHSSQSAAAAGAVVMGTGGAGVSNSIQAPGADVPAPIDAPSPTGMNDVMIKDPAYSWKYRAPGAGSNVPAEAPGVATDVAIDAPAAGVAERWGLARILGGLASAVGWVLLSATMLKSDGPRPEDIQGRKDDEERRLIRSNTPHDHHIFPQDYVEEFRQIGIDVDLYTITIPARVHIGSDGLHKRLDYNGEWQDFFYSHDSKPTKKAAFDLATELLNRAGLAGPEYPIHPFRRPP